MANREQLIAKMIKEDGAALGTRVEVEKYISVVWEKNGSIFFIN